jgi:hypothetical protein
VVRRSALLGYLLLPLFLVPPLTGAQEATPDPALDIPAPEECTVAPRTLAELQALFATPATPTAAPASPTPVALPTGSPVDAATAEAVTAALRQLLACSNAGDYWRLLATYSDRFVQIFLHAYVNPAQGVTQQLYDDYSTLVPPEPALRTGLLDIGPIIQLPDGRVAIAAVADVPGDDQPPRQSIFYLVKNGDQWRVDDFAYMPVGS